MKNLGELEEYIEKTEDMQLSTLVEIVREYGNGIPGIINKIKEKHVENEDRSKAELIFSTVHRCKGMEYDAIELTSDFITPEKLEKLKDDIGVETLFSKLNEEINLLYVAVTRTTGMLYIPEALLPAGFPASDQIHLIKPTDNKGKYTMPVFARPLPSQRDREMKRSTKAYSTEEIRKEHEGAYLPWAAEEDAHLRARFNRGIRIPEISAHFGRTTGAIRSRLKKIGLIKTEQVKK
jgi:superfamily I DNA/RNA helicase